ncbi:MAG: NADH-quinone oxidoreductase subunit H [Methanomicrobiales archaeon]|nr:NADH-quinone oxidoreductase subunit H [Methanomicrobiales archaeon]
MILSLVVPVLTGIAVACFGILFGLILLGVDRVLAARMQARIGPPLLQPFTDVRKLFCKENITPSNAVTWIFHLAPVVGLASVLTILLYLPIAGLPPVLGGGGDLILVMYLLTVPALALVAGGFASSSPYATVGAQREMVTMMAYEFPLAIVIIAIAWRLSIAGTALPFTIGALSAAPIWGIVGPLGVIGGIVLLVTLLIVTPAELSRIPFDSPEAETELAGGILVEYSGKNLGIFSLTQGVKTVVMGALVVAIFIPYSLASWLGLQGALGMVIDLLAFMVKVLVISTIAVTIVRVSMTRFRINQVVSMHWLYLSFIGVIGLVLMVVDGLGGV